MRLGWLSRLGIVLTAFGLPIAALSLATYENAQITELRTTLFNSCMKVAQDALPENQSRLIDQCWKERFSPVDAKSIWSESLAAVAILFGIAWVLVLAIYWSTRWVLAGRRPRTN